MKKKQQISLLLALNLAVCANVYAGNANISLAGTIPTFVPDNKVLKAEGPSAAATTKSGHYVMLERIKLSESAYKYLKNSLHNADKSHLNVSTTGLPSRVDIGMNDVPVLDQGRHGSCVTFAVTGAFDAALGHTDYISQLCQLNLGSYLENQDSTYPSGWNGSWNYIVIGQMQNYGIVSLDYQHSVGCGASDQKEYPLNDEGNEGKPMSVGDFTSHSEKIIPPITRNTLLSVDDAMSHNADMEKVFKDVKQALANGHRVVFGVLVDVNGVLAFINGAAGSYKTHNDSWILTKRIIDDADNDKIDAGHDLVITGYDDNAYITGLLQ